MSESYNEEEASLEDFYRYFARWEEAYPGGVPLEYIESPKALFLVEGVDSGDEEKIKELFIAIIDKGLRWKRGEGKLIFVDRDSSGLSKLISQYGESWWVFCGELSQEVRNSVQENVSQEKIVETASLSSVLVDRDEKKRLWADIQRLL